MLNRYQCWCEKAPLSPYADEDVLRELSDMKGNTEKIEDAFYRSLAFGTGGLRGIIGAGDNRMNVYTVAKASQGLADYVNYAVQKNEKSIAISYDSRIKSELFAAVSAGVFAANGIRVYLFPHIAPTPALSFAVRHLGCSAGVMVTASHNPAAYNGYKVYGSDGCQITDTAAGEILSFIEKTDIFDGVRYMPLEKGIALGDISYIEESVENAYLSSVLSLSLLGDSTVDKSFPIVYTPLNGTGLSFVTRALAAAGFTNVKTVKEQTAPDGRFPSCPYPNPEVKEALALGLRDAKAHSAELLLATDPDCDRVGIAVRDKTGSYRLLSGNEVGLLLLDYIARRRKATGKMPKHPVCIKTIVSDSLAELLALKYGIRTVNVLTGFKYIGEKIGEMEREGRADDFILGFEESYGYLSGTHVRDKDGVNAALLIAEMVAYFKKEGYSLPERLERLYEKHGYSINTLYSYDFPGSAGAEKMKKVMAHVRAGAKKIGGLQVLSSVDYAKGIDGLPPSDVVKLFLEKRCTVTVRPSGTEPKIKIYLSAIRETKADAERTEFLLREDLKSIFS